MLGDQLAKEDQHLLTKVNNLKHQPQSPKKWLSTTTQMKSTACKTCKLLTAKIKMPNHCRLGLAEADLYSRKNNRRKSPVGNAINYTFQMKRPANSKPTKRPSARLSAISSIWMLMPRVASLKDVGRNSWNQSELIFMVDGFAAMNMLIKIQKLLSWVKWFRMRKHMMRMGNP